MMSRENLNSLDFLVATENKNMRQFGVAHEI